jgi:hypothetical protein
MNNLKAKLSYSPLSDTIYIYRHGKDPALALEKVNAMGNFLFVLTQWMLHDMPEGAKTVFMSDSKYYELTLKPITEDEYKARKDKR